MNPPLKQVRDDSLLGQLGRHFTNQSCTGRHLEGEQGIKSPMPNGAGMPLWRLASSDRRDLTFMANARRGFT